MVRDRKCAGRQARSGREKLEAERGLEEKEGQ